MRPMMRPMMTSERSADQARAVFGARVPVERVAPQFLQAVLTQTFVGACAAAVLVCSSWIAKGPDGAAWEPVLVGVLTIATFLIYPAVALILAGLFAWTLLPLALLLRSTRRPSTGLLVAVLTSAMIVAGVAWATSIPPPEHAIEFPVRAFVPPTIPWHDTVFFQPSILTGCYLLPVVCWLGLPLRFVRVWWPLSVFAMTGAVLGFFLDAGLGPVAGDLPIAIFSSHAAFVLGLIWCRARSGRRTAWGPQAGRRSHHSSLEPSADKLAQHFGAQPAEPETRA